MKDQGFGKPFNERRLGTRLVVRVEMWVEMRLAKPVMKGKEPLVKPVIKRETVEQAESRINTYYYKKLIAQRKKNSRRQE